VTFSFIVVGAGKQVLIGKSKTVYPPLLKELVMIEELGCQQIEEILKNTTGSNLIPKYSDEDRWRKIMENPMLSLSFEDYGKRLDKPRERRR